MVNCILLLLEQKEININSVDSEGHNALIYVITYTKNRYLNLFEKILSLDNNLDFLDNKNNNYFIITCKYASNSFLKILLKYHRYDVNAKNNKGKTGWHYLCKYGNIEIMQYLLNING